MKHRRAFREHTRHTLTSGWDAVSQSTDKLIMDLVESGCDVPCQLGTDDASVIRVVHVQEFEGVFGLKELM
jgi:hypothetical protein